GVGGIIRDIFTMGARPVCALNSLRFGPITEDGPPHPGPLPPGGREGKGKVNRSPEELNSAGTAGRLELHEGESGSVGEPVSVIAPDSKIANRKSQIANNRRLFAGVGGGIAHYGNCFGIPTIGGEIYFDQCYEGN